MPTSAQQQYREVYLASTHWVEFRAEWWQDHPGAPCARCGTVDRARDLHHLTYARRGHEHQDDVVALCRQCHDRAHGPKGKPKAAKDSGVTQLPAAGRRVMLQNATKAKKPKPPPMPRRIQAFDVLEPLAQALAAENTARRKKSGRPVPRKGAAPRPRKAQPHTVRPRKGAGRVSTPFDKATLCGQEAVRSRDQKAAKNKKR